MKTPKSRRKYASIAKLHSLICRELFTINAKLDYNQLAPIFSKLASLIESYPEDSEQLWYIGESDYATLDNLLVGAYWHYSQWCSGMWSPEYATMCAIGQVFSPGMSSSPQRGEPEFEAYNALNRLARKRHKMPVYDFVKLY